MPYQSSVLFSSNQKSIIDVNQLKNSERRRMEQDFETQLKYWKLYRFRNDIQNQTKHLEYLLRLAKQLRLVQQAYKDDDSGTSGVIAEIEKQLTFVYTKQSQLLTTKALKFKEDKDANDTANIQLVESNNDTFNKTLQFLEKTASWVGYLNLMRLHLVFLRSTFFTSITIAHDYDFFDYIRKNWGISNDHAGVHATPEAMMDFLNKTRAVTNVLSVAFFVARFVLDSIVIALKALSTSEAEKKKRFLKDFYEKAAHFLNDGFWPILNFITNYNDLVGISNDLASQLIVGGLCLDALLGVRVWMKDYKDYKKMKAAYLEELSGLAPDTEEYKIVLRNLRELRIKWEATLDTHLYSVTAALVFVLAVTIPLIAPYFAPIIALPFIQIVSDLITNLVMGLYLSTEKFAIMRQKARELEWHKNNIQIETGESKPFIPSNDGNLLQAPNLNDRLYQYQLELLEKEYAMACKNFYICLSVYTIVPLLLVGLSSICWIAAAVLGPVVLGSIKYGIYTMEQDQAKEIEVMQNAFNDDENAKEEERSNQQRIELDDRSEEDIFSDTYQKQEIRVSV